MFTTLSPRTEEQRFFFHDPKLSFTSLGRVVYRTSAYLAYILIIAVTATLLLTDLPGLRALGILGGLWIIDHFLHLRQSEKKFSSLKQHGPINLAHFTTPQALHLIEKAHDRAHFLKKSFFLELSRQLVRTKDIQLILDRLEVDRKNFESAIEDVLLHASEEGENLPTQEQMDAFMSYAAGLAIREAEEGIDVHHLFASLGEVSRLIEDRLFFPFGISREDAERAVILTSLKKSYHWWQKLPQALAYVKTGGARAMRHRVVNRAWTSRPTYFLDRVSTDLTDLARAGEVGFMRGHKAEYEELKSTLGRAINPNALLVGPEGVGKHVMLEHLAWEITKDRVPEALYDKRLIVLDIPALVAEGRPEEIEPRVKRVIAEILTAGNIILVFPDIHELLKTSGPGYLSAADGFSAVWRNNTFPVIGLTNPEEWQRHISSRSDINNLFEAILVQEVSVEDAEVILSYRAALLESEHSVLISYPSIKSAVASAKRYMRGKFLPGSADEIIKEATGSILEKGEVRVTKEDVLRIVERKSRVPILKAGQGESEILLDLESHLGKRVIGQEEAVRVVSDALRSRRSGLSEEEEPVGSFLFVGSSGVGKTELAKALAEIYFKSSSRLIRFDMSEFASESGVERLIGSGDGKIPGLLVGAIIREPASLILFDELEKSHPTVQNLLLQLIDEGRLTDGLGRTVDFSQALIIATSNAHQEIIRENLHQGGRVKDIREYMKSKLADIFKPELLNRFSQIVVFNDLSPKDIEQIVQIELASLKERISQKRINIEFDPSAIQELVRLGYNPEEGARPLRGVVEQKIQSELSKVFLREELAPGTKIKVSSSGSGIFTLGIER